MAPTRTRRDVELVKNHDRDFDGDKTALMTRMKAIVDAQHAVVHHELGAGYALRPTSEALADEPPPPPSSS